LRIHGRWSCAGVLQQPGCMGGFLPVSGKFQQRNCGDQFAAIMACDHCGSCSEGNTQVAKNCGEPRTRGGSPHSWRKLVLTIRASSLPLAKIAGEEIKASRWTPR